MSVIKVNKIEHTGTTAGGIEVDSSGHVQVDGQQLPTAGPLSNRNLFINGAMQVAQRGTSKTGLTGTSIPTCDRMNWVLNTAGTWTVSQESDGPKGFTKSFKALCTTADASPAAGDYAILQYKVEAQDVQHLNYGTSDALQMTVSFWVKSNKTGNASFAILQTDNSYRQMGNSYTINAANTWEYKTISIPADTSGVINDDNGEGFLIEWWSNSGSTFTGGSHSTTWEANADANRNASNIGVGQAVNDYWQITGIQLEVGEKATPFEHRSYGDELQKCLRYFYKAEWSFLNKLSGLSYRFITPGPATVMRTAPAHSYFNPSTGTANQVREHSSGTARAVNDNTNAGSTAGGPTTYVGTSTSSTYAVQSTIHYDAEL